MKHVILELYLASKGIGFAMPASSETSGLRYNSTAVALSRSTKASCHPQQFPLHGFVWFGFHVHQVQRHRRVALAIASHAFIPAEGSYLPCLLWHHHWFIEVHQCLAGSSGLHLLWREDFLCMSSACVHNHRRRKTNSRLAKSGLHSCKHGRRHLSTYMYHLHHQQ